MSEESMRYDYTVAGISDAEIKEIAMECVKSIASDSIDANALLMKYAFKLIELRKVREVSKKKVAEYEEAKRAAERSQAIDAYNKSLEDEDEILPNPFAK